ncbi:MAG: glutamate synthase subunit beta [Coriobacteriales bacterium]|jgi:glutamate synthase (NADPH/NADH) small chain|nr:glutamate synthase subunit beta [Coriobacteriales bacterium]
MGKPTGFLEFARADATGRGIAERVKDYHEFHTGLSPDTIMQQAARCMDCGVSFCHAGLSVDGLSIGCPLSNLIPEINDLVYRGMPSEAYARLRVTHPFPEFTGRVCPALCEGSCTLGEHEQPVAVKEIEHYLDAFAHAEGLAGARMPAVRTGRRVAVVGSGPAGLACADVLNQLGEDVVVFERAERPGGLLMFGIPNMKLDKQVVLRRIAVMEEEGVIFKNGFEVGRDIPVQELLGSFDAVVLCGGATVARMPDIAGTGLAGVVPAVRYLTNATRLLLDGTATEEGDTLNARDKDVIIIGGGDTGTDCVATALRQGAKSIAQFEITPKPCAERAPDNPWPLWPRVFKTDYGQHEAAAVFGEDPREYEISAKELVGGSVGEVVAVKTVRYEWVTSNGRFGPREIEGSEAVRNAGLVLVAMGFLGPERTLIDALGLDTDPRGNIKTPEGSYQTSQEAVFAAGDMRRGQSLVVWSLMEGRDAAAECHAYLDSRKK